MEDRDRMYWRKSWIDENLMGSIRIDLLPAERSVWYDLCDICGKSRRWGVIERSQGIPYTAEDLAYLFKTPIEIVQSTIDKCLAEGRLQRDTTGALVVTHWDKYQIRPSKKHKGKQGQDIPMALEDREAGQQAAAARLGYLQPGAAKRGIEQREAERKARR